MLAPQAHSGRCVQPLPQGEAAAADFPDRVGQAAPSRTARLHRGSLLQTAPPPCCTAQSPRQDDSVAAAGRRIERCVQVAAHDPLAETGYKWRAPWFRPLVPRAGQKEVRSKSLPDPADPFARTSHRAPAWLLDVAASRPGRRDTLRSRPRHGSSRGSAWRDPDVCLRLRPSLKVAFAVTEKLSIRCQTVANYPHHRILSLGCASRRTRTALFNYIPPAGSGKTARHRLMRYTSPESTPRLQRSLLGSNNMSVAEANNETPATPTPPYNLPVFCLIQPLPHAPANPPPFPTHPP